MNKKLLFFSLLAVLIMHVLMIFILVSFESSQNSTIDNFQEPMYLKFTNTPPESKKNKIELPPTPKSPKKNVLTKINEKSTPNFLTKPDIIDERISSNKIQKPKKRQPKTNFQGPVNTEIDTASTVPVAGRLSILAFYGEYRLDSTPIGNGYLEVVYPDSHKYNIKLVANVIGWASIFVKKPLIFESSGELTSQNGFSPNLYKENTPRRGQSYVKRDNFKKTLFFSSTKQSLIYVNTPLHDPLSLIFQLAWLSAQTSRIEFNKLSSFFVFNRKKLKELRLTADLPEEIVLPGGIIVEAIKIKSTVIESRRPGVMTFWLDPADNFLPVRISYKEEKTKKTLDFLVIRNDEYFLNENETNTQINDSSTIEKKSHHYLPNY